MANQQHLNIIFRGVRNWNTWREANSSEWPDFSGANLEKLNLTEVNLRRTYLDDLNGGFPIEANLTNTNLTNANLTKADLTGANLTGANLSRANLNHAQLDYADLTDADFTGADLVETNFSGACLKGTNLAGAHMKLTFFGNIDLRNAKGLEAVNHHGPSTIGTDTLSRSGGNIPEMFLRKAGVSDDLITYTVSLANKQLKYYTCVISYSKQDQDFA